MWLLKLHIAISVLCLLSSIGVKIVFKDRLKRFQRDQAKKTRYRNGLLFFCPVINVGLTVGFWYMALCDDTEAQLLMLNADDEQREKIE